MTCNFDTIAVSKNMARLLDEKIHEAPNMQSFASVAVIKDNWLSDNIIVCLLKGQVVAVYDLNKENK